MYFWLYRASIPVFVRGLEVLAQLLEEGLAHADQVGLGRDELLQARLAPDMFGLAAQVDFAVHTAIGTARKLMGQEAPEFRFSTAAVPDLKAKLALAIEQLEAVAPQSIPAPGADMIELKAGEIDHRFQNDDYIFQFALPNFFFHISIAHGILRNNNVPIGKVHYLGRF